MVKRRNVTKGPFPLLRLPREIRDQILGDILAPDCLLANACSLGFYTTRAKDGSAYRHILGNKLSSIAHPIRRANKQLYAESTDVLRRLLSSLPFKFGPSDSWMTHLIVQAMSNGLCSVVSAMSLDASAFESGNSNDRLWSATSRVGHIGELILHKLPNLRRVQIMTPQRNCWYRLEGHFPEDKCVAKRYSIYDQCAQFFSKALKGGRIDRLELVIKRDVAQMTTDGDILSTDPAFIYFVARREPWNQFKILKTFTEQAAKSASGPFDMRGEPSCYGWNANRTWTLAYEQKGNRACSVNCGRCARKYAFQR